MGTPFLFRPAWPLVTPGTKSGITLLNRFHYGHLIFIQRHGEIFTILISEFLADDKGQGIHLPFFVFVFTFVNTQPEHDFAFSA
jgi:hypothetical protein